MNHALSCEKADERLHPIAERAVELWLLGEGTFTDSALGEIGDTIAALAVAADEDVIWAMASLLKIASYIAGKHGAESAAMRLLERCTVLIPTLLRVHEPLFTAARELLERSKREEYADLTGERSKPALPAAPAVGSDPGAQPLHALMPRRKIS
jgi:hypothetical protein